MTKKARCATRRPVRSARGQIPREDEHARVPERR